MIEVKSNILNVRNQNTKKFESVPSVVGASAYEIAVKHGYVGTEAEWIRMLTGKGGHTETVATAERTKYLKIDNAVGSAEVGVYFNSSGLPTESNYILNESCELDASDEPNVGKKTLMTNKAVQKALKGLTQKAVVPTVNGRLVYTGTKQSPSWLNFDESIVEMGGTKEAVNAGSYTTTFTPKPPYLWEDGTDKTVSIQWNIEKAQGSLRVDKTHIELTPEKTGDVITIIRNGDGVLSIVNSDADIASAILLDNNTLTINGNGINSGSTKITISMAASSNYTLASDVVISIDANYLTIVSWSEATDIQVTNMLTAHYNGDIDISDYWSVGDTKTINLSTVSKGNVGEVQNQQAMELTIIGMDHDELVSPIKNKSRAAITVQAKGCLSSLGYMNSGSVATPWALSARREWCNNNFKNALPQGFARIIKPVIKLTNRYSTNTITPSHNTTNEDVFFLSDWELLGKNYLPSASYGSLEPDGTQYQFMTIIANRIKKLNGFTNDWWLRTSYSDDIAEFYLICATNGDCAAGNSGGNRGISPAFCL